MNVYWNQLSKNKAIGALFGILFACTVIALRNAIQDSPLVLLIVLVKLPSVPVIILEWIRGYSGNSVDLIVGCAITWAIIGAVVVAARRRVRICWVPVLAGYLCFSVVLWVIAGFAIPYRPSLTEVSEMTGIVFSQSSRLIEGNYEEGFQSGHLLAKIQMAQSDARVLVDHMSVSANEWRCEDRCGVVDHEEYPNWWRPNSARDFRAVDVQAGENSHMLRLLVDKDDPKMAIVYLEATGRM